MNLRDRIPLRDELRPKPSPDSTLAFLIALAALAPVVAAIIWILNR